MYRRGISLFWLAFLIIGAFVAADHDYFKHVNSVEEVISAILAVTLWPLVLLDVNLHIEESLVTPLL
jgi:uncharacterized membrane protein